MRNLLMVCVGAMIFTACNAGPGGDLVARYEPQIAIFGKIEIREYDPLRTYEGLDVQYTSSLQARSGSTFSTIGALAANIDVHGAADKFCASKGSSVARPWKFSPLEAGVSHQTMYFNCS